MKRNTIYHGDALEVLKTFPDNSIDCCVTSIPYWGLRDYGTGKWIGGDKNCKHQRKKHGDKCITGTRNVIGGTGNGIYKDVCNMCGAIRKDAQIGLEKTPGEFVTKIVKVFMEVLRVLKPTGTLWLNIGDTYAQSSYGTGGGWAKNEKPYHNAPSQKRSLFSDPGYKHGLKNKNIVGIPFRVAFALQEAGWYLRQDIIWNKPNPMPESVTDRCTKAHEYIFLLSKSPNYYYDAEAIKTESFDPNDDRGGRGNQKRIPTEKISGIRNSGIYPKANKRSVWTVTTQPYSEAHFATFPEKLIEPCILAGTSEKGCCSECGKPYKRIVKKKLIPTYKASFNSVIDKRDLEADIQDQGSNRSKDGHKPLWAYYSETVGWRATCKCEAEIVPAIVLDPFNGSGTTTILSRKKGRDSIGIELNEKYIEMSNKRSHKELGIFS
jgi:DNA modification methylase